jgi:radical SAM superfamily enzyme YgiQ (UPF0313 family)
MKIALVWPYGNDFTYALPLGLGFLVSNCTVPDVEIRIFDGTLYDAPHDSVRFRDFLRSFRPDVVGISCWSKIFPETVAIVATVKSLLPDAITMLGGIHPTVYAEKSLEICGADYILAGESEFTFNEFISAIGDTARLSLIPGLMMRSSTNGFSSTPACPPVDLDSIAYPDYHAIELTKYFSKGYRYFSRTPRNAPIWMTRGCPYGCKFCSAPVINGRKLRMHSVEYGIEWIDMLYREFGVRHINIIDDNFTFYPDYTKRFCEALIRKEYRDLTVYAANGIRAQRTDLETLKLMKRAGWNTVTVAPESGSRRVLKLMEKELDPDMWPAKVNDIRAAGLRSHGLFLIGYPGETLATLQETEKLIKKCGFDSIGIQYFQPLPGTPVYDKLVQQGEIEDTLLPNSTTGSRVYVTRDLANFNFSRFALKMYLLNASNHPFGALREMLSYNPRLITKRLVTLFYDTLLGIIKHKNQR